MTTHKTIHDYIPLAKSLGAEGFVAHHPHPFLFGREVLEEEFRFSTIITDEASVEGSGRSQDGQHDPFSAARMPTTDVFRIRHWVIVVKKPSQAPAQDRVFLGRSETNDISLPHKTVSKLHAYFQRDANVLTKWQLVDTGSANGTKHNGMRIPARAKVSLGDGDTICFGRCVFQWMTARSLYDRLMLLGPNA